MEAAPGPPLDSTDPTTAPEPLSRRALVKAATGRALRPALLLLVVLAPSLLLIVLGYAGGAMGLVLGSVLSVGIALLAGSRPVLLAGVAAVPVVVIAAVLGDWWLAAGLLVGILGLATGMAARAGLQGVVAILPMVAAVYLGREPDLGVGLLVALAVAAGIAYGAVVGGLLHRRLGLPAGAPALDRDPALLLGVALGLLAGGLAAALVELDIPNGYWAIITIFVVFRPNRGESSHKAADRVAGTIAGGLLGLGVITVIDAPALLAIAAVGVIYAGLLVASTHPRWMTAASTAAIVLASGTAAGAEATALLRVAMVVVGVLAVLVAAAIGERLAARRAAPLGGAASPCA